MSDRQAAGAKAHPAQLHPAAQQGDASADHSKGPSRLVTLVVAAVMAMAFVSCEPITDLGVLYVGKQEDGIVVVTMMESRGGSLHRRGSASTSDGGRTWTIVNGPRQGVVNSESVKTPRGTYTIRDSGIALLKASGDSEIVYSTSYLQRDGNLWVQRVTTTQFGDRRLAKAPSGIVYDDSTGNVIAAMGLQGVVVGTPDGEWMRYSVGPWVPTDFSFSGKARLLLFDVDALFWTIVLASSISTTGIALVFSLYPRNREKGPLVLAGSVALALLIAVLGAIILVLMTKSLWGAIAAPLGGGVIAFMAKKRGGFLAELLMFIGLLSLVASVILSVFLLVYFLPRLEFDYPNAQRPILLFIIFVLFLPTILALAASAGELRCWGAAAASLVGMSILVVLAFVLWLYVGIVTILLHVLTVALLALAAFVLFRYATRQEQVVQ